MTNIVEARGRYSDETLPTPPPGHRLDVGLQAVIVDLGTHASTSMAAVLNVADIPTAEAVEDRVLHVLLADGLAGRAEGRHDVVVVFPCARRPA